MKEDSYEDALALFADQDIRITKEGHRYLGGTIGESSFTKTFTEAKVATWSSELLHLCEIAQSQPHTAYAAFTHGLKLKWNFLTRVCNENSPLLQSLEDIRHKFIPALIGKNAVSDLERDLLALPTRLGGMGITNPVSTANVHSTSSKSITALMASLIKKQAMSIPMEPFERFQIA